MKAILVILLILGLGAIYAIAISNTTSPPAATFETRAMERARRDEVRANLSLRNFSWSANNNVMIANFTFSNASDYDVKDVELRCTHSAPSGTQIDQNVRTVYEIVPARGEKRIRDFNMGFVPNQATRSGCVIADFIVGSHKAPPPNKVAPANPTAAPKPVADKPLSVTPK